jgi:hypothetical protein
MTTLAAIAKELAIADRQLRVADGNQIIAVAGALGLVKPAGEGNPDHQLTASPLSSAAILSIRDSCHRSDNGSVMNDLDDVEPRIRIKLSDGTTLSRWRKRQ